MFDREMLAVWLWAGINNLRGKDSERGDVPGWVMVTVMTAMLVVILIGVFRTRIADIVNNALNAVTDGAGQ